MGIWVPPKMWEGQDCWIIGGGPSILRQFEVPPEVAERFKRREIPLNELSQYLFPLRDRNTIGINNAYLIADWIKIVFFGDCSWYVPHKHALSEWPGLKVTCCPRFAKLKKAESVGIKYMRKDRQRKPKGISTAPGYVAWNNNSGAAALSLAVQLGVKRIILLGFDMCIDTEDKYHTHWHGYHVELHSARVVGAPHKKRPTGPSKNPRYMQHLKGFPAIARDAKELGVEILNASPESEIKDFRKITVKELLNVA